MKEKFSRPPIFISPLFFVFFLEILSDILLECSYKTIAKIYKVQ